MIDHQTLCDLLDYELETGIFRWIKSRGTARAGNIAGKKSQRIQIDNISYDAGRLAWFYVYGRWPSPQLDHANCNHFDNRFVNLRDATPTQNQANRRVQRNSRSGVKGAWWSNAHKAWRVMIRIDGKKKFVGYYKTLDAAAAAYLAAAQRVYGEFARAA